MGCFFALRPCAVCLQDFLQEMNATSNRCGEVSNRWLEGEQRAARPRSPHSARGPCGAPARPAAACASRACLYEIHPSLFSEKSCQFIQVNDVPTSDLLPRRQLGRHFQIPVVFIGMVFTRKLTYVNFSSCHFRMLKTNCQFENQYLLMFRTLLI